MNTSPQSPLFSVVIPAYNAERFIGLTIKSILRQTVQDFEIVVVNDGSTDGTAELLASIQDTRLRVVHRENGGECVARNHGLREARGKYIAFLDSDDVWLTNHLEQALYFLETHVEIPWFSSTLKQINGDIMETDIKAVDLSVQRIHICNWYLEGVPYTLPSSVTVRRDAAQEFPHLFQEGYRMFGDNIGWCKFAKKHPLIGMSNTPTVLYRFWQGNASTTYNVHRYGERTQAVKMALLKHMEFFLEPDCPAEAKLYYRHFALGNWWACISSAFLPKDWIEDLAERRALLGTAPCLWIRLLAFASDGMLHIMRWGIRMRKQAIGRTMKKIARRVRKEALPAAYGKQS